MVITNYIDGTKVDRKDLHKYELDNDIISKTIRDVNERLQTNFHQKETESQGS